MSVINKMLRDLDRRANPSAAAQPGPAALRQGTASVAIDTLAPPQRPAITSTPMWLGLGLLTVAAATVGGWMWWESAATAPAVTGAVSAVAPVVEAPPAVAASSAASSSADAGAEASLASVFLRMEPSLSARKALDVLLSTPPPVAASTPPNVPPMAPTNAASAATAATPLERPAARPQASKPATPPSPAPSATGDSTPVLQRQQQAGGDALAQAQALWSSGSRDAAIDLVQQSIAAAERSAKANGPSASGTAVLLPLVREMARMQLAEARFGAVWEMLTRLEPLLGNPPDLWAIRANAAQRLGRHQDSVHAYMMALQSRPDEQRWLLGTAVSLAALGQTSSAAEMAEKARALGPVGKDILAYLRQAGVPLREQ